MLQEDLTLPIGAIIQDREGNRYVVDDLLGQGGFSAVYLVHGRRAKQKTYALKEIIDPDNQERKHLTFEAEVLRRLKHPSLPYVYQVFEDNKLSRLYMLMDYVEGQNLEVLRHEQPYNRFSLALALALLTPIVDALTYLHSQNPPIVHRDIKPANIVVPQGASDAVLVDFGLAKEYVEDKTTSVVRYGTPGYAAPEQYGQGTNTRTDIYAMGATLYTLLSGHPPADALSRTFASTNDDPYRSAHEVSPGVSRRVSDVITRAMRLRREERYATIEEFWQALSIAVIQPDTPALPGIAFTSTPYAAGQNPASLFEDTEHRQPTPQTPPMQQNQQAPQTGQRVTINAAQNTRPQLAPAQTDGQPRQRRYTRKADVSAYQQQQRNRRRRRRQIGLATAALVLLIIIGNATLVTFILHTQSTKQNNNGHTVATHVGTNKNASDCNSAFAITSGTQGNYPLLAECYAGTMNSMQTDGSGKRPGFTITNMHQDQGSLTATGIFPFFKQPIKLQGTITRDMHVAFRGQYATSRLTMTAIVDSNGALQGGEFSIDDALTNQRTNYGEFYAQSTAK